MSVRLPRNETELVRLAASCNDAAFCAIHKRYRALIRSLARRFASTPDDCDDMEADLVAKLLEDKKRILRKWEPLAPFAAYLTTIATRRFMAQSKRANRLTEIPIGSLPGRDTEASTDSMDRLLRADDASDPWTSLDQAESQRLVATALSHLSDRDRLVLMLRFHDGLTGPVIATTLGTSQGAVRQRVFKALQRLERSLLAEAPEQFNGYSDQENDATDR